MIKLKRFEEEGIEINWLTIVIGWYGPGKYTRLLLNKDIIEYATNLIVEQNNQEEQVLMLASCREQDSEEIDTILNKLALGVVTSKDTEERKWVLILLKDLLFSISSNLIQGLVEITSFWEKFNYPSYSPHIIQGVNNNIKPKDYYSEQNYKKIIEAHKIWVENQLKSVKNN
jgi:hypothetical protein